jgi:hypothetical protein
MEVSTLGAIEYVDEHAVNRLGELGVDLAWIIRSLQRGDAEARTVSLLAPKGFEGTTRWGRSAEAFREETTEAGWTPDDTLNIARSVNPAGDLSIVVTTGSKGTGEAEKSPSTKYNKGSGVAASVATNALVLDFDAEFLAKTGLPSAEAAAKMQTWFLLFLLVGNKIYSELSLPDAIGQDGFITSWRERIINPVIELGPDLVIGEDDTGPTDPVNVPVSRR